jgi:hypothetical protein
LSREVQYTGNQYKDELTWLSQEPPSLRPRFVCSSRRIELAGQPSESIDNRRRDYRDRAFASCWSLVLGTIWTLAGRVRFINRFLYLPVTGERICY